jgi:hypothetical protein
MPAVIEAQPIVTQAQCFACEIPTGLIWYAVLAAYLDIANGDPVPATAQEIVSEARCLQNCIPTGYLPYAILAAIVNGGVGGASQIYEYTPPGPPGFNPTDITKTAIAYDPAGIAASYNWNITLAIWV